MYGGILPKCEGRKGHEAPWDPNPSDPSNHRTGMDATLTD